MQLRAYQDQLKHDIRVAWQSARNVLMVLPTAGGKTATIASLNRDLGLSTAIVAHRQELVGQLSAAQANEGITHRIIAPQAVINFCIQQNIKRFGRSFHHAQSTVGVCGVDTLIRRVEALEQWRNSIRVWEIDEGHHVLPGNKWGKAVTMFPNAYGLAMTATPRRADRKSLGRKNGGLFDAMVEGPSMRQLIDMGYLADYKVFAPPPSINRDEIKTAAGGEFDQADMRDKAHKSTITGDIVDHWIKLTPGKLGITFTVDVESAVETAAAYRQKGVPAEAITGETPDTVRAALMDKFQRGEIKQLVNVDLFGEGLDVPGVEVISMGRPTKSLAVYLQQIGRALRTAPGKAKGVLLDHVGNFIYHKAPDMPRFWSLDDEEYAKRSRTPDDLIPLTSCTKCFQPREATIRVCPYCGHVETPAARSLPQFVDGDLIEFGPELLATLGREQARLDGPARYPLNGSHVIRAAIGHDWEKRQEAQRTLRDCIAVWSDIGRAEGRSDSEMYRRFYFMFGVDVATAKTLGRPEAEKLTGLIRETMT